MAKGRFVLMFAGLGILGSGCSTANVAHDAEYADLSYKVQQALATTPEETVDPVVAELEGPHPVEEYIQAAIFQNPGIQAARKRLEAAGYQVPVAGSLQDPMLNLTVQPSPVETAAGKQQTILAANQKLPWFGKLDRRGARAEAETDVVRAELAAAELMVIEQVQRAYYELYFIQQAIAVTEEEQDLLAQIRDVANARYKAGKTSQQDVLRAELEISNVQKDLIGLRQQRKSGQAALAGLLHIAPQSNVEALDKLPASQIVRDLESLEEQAVAARPELHAKLAALERDQQAVELALLEYKPDVTVGFSWIGVSNSGISPVANGRDAFLLTAGINLPVYRRRLDAEVRSVEAKAVATAREYDAIRDNTLAQVVDLFAKVQSQRDLLTLFEQDILPRSRQTLEVSSQAYNVGEVDFLQLLDNWRELLRYEIAYRRIDASLRQTLAELERVVGGFLGPIPEPANPMPNAPPPAEAEKPEAQPPRPENPNPTANGDQKPRDESATAEESEAFWPVPNSRITPASVH